MIINSIKNFSSELFDDISKIKQTWIKNSWNNDKKKVLSVAMRVLAVAFIAISTVVASITFINICTAGLLGKIITAAGIAALAHDCIIIDKNYSTPTNSKESKLKTLIINKLHNIKLELLETSHPLFNNTWLIGKIPVYNSNMLKKIAEDKKND